jgi:hypothetical protein
MLTGVPGCANAPLFFPYLCAFASLRETLLNSLQ